MKKILLLMMCCPAMLAAQNGNGVTVSNLNVASGTVTFNVSWKSAGMPTLWSDSVWVFVDYNKNGVMTRLPVTSATATAGIVTKIQSNDKGVWVVGNARSAGSFSATVQLLSATDNLSGVCAYASNYPPVGEYTSSAKISFTGTPPYDLVLTSAESGTYTYSINAGYYKLYAGETILSFTDKTGAPGSIAEITYATPPLAFSAATWSFGSSTLIWSDRIASSQINCTKVNTTATSGTPSEYAEKNGNYYINWHCATGAEPPLCPSPWRLPTKADFEDLIANTTHTAVLAIWPAAGFWTGGSSAPDVADGVFFWSSTPSNAATPSAWWARARPSEWQLRGDWYYLCGMTVVCVK
jgi:hypothetical protein